MNNECRQITVNNILSQASNNLALLLNKPVKVSIVELDKRAEAIIDIVCSEFKVTRDELTNPYLRKHIDAKDTAIWLYKICFKKSDPVIGLAFFKSLGSTKYLVNISYSAKKIAGLMSTGVDKICPIVGRCWERIIIINF